MPFSQIQNTTFIVYRIIASLLSLASLSQFLWLMKREQKGSSKGLKNATALLTFVIFLIFLLMAASPWFYQQCLSFEELAALDLMGTIWTVTVYNILLVTGFVLYIQIIYYRSKAIIQTLPPLHFRIINVSRILISILYVFSV